jgi:uncharacterized protein YndB with AHSA1/START domain
MTGKVSIDRIIDAPIERVWQAWTIADELKQWFSSQTEELEVIAFDVKPGGKVRLQSSSSAGEYTWTYIKIDKPNELVFDVLDFSLPQYPDGIGGVCHVSFKAIGDKTEVTVAGELPSESLRKKYQRLLTGWLDTLDKLNRFINKDI